MALASLVCVAALCPVAWSQAPYGRPSAADPALQQLIAARGELRDAESALAELTQTLKAKLEASDPEWARLCRAARDAAADRDRVHEATIAAAKTTPQYIAAGDALAKAEERLRRLTDACDTVGREFARLDDQAYALRNRLREFEALALEGSTELRTAESRCLDARHAMEAYWDRYSTEVLAGDPTWMQALRRRDDAAAAVKASETAFISSRRQAAAAYPVSARGTYGHHGSRSNSRSGSYRSSSRSRQSSYR